MAYSRTAGPVTHQASQRPVLRLPLRFLGKTGHPVPAIPSHLAKLPLRFLGTILCRPAMDERGPMDEGGSSNGRAWFREFPAEVKTDWDSSRFWVQLSGISLRLPEYALGKSVTLEMAIRGKSIRLPTLAIPNEQALEENVRFCCNLPVHKFDPLVLKAVIFRDKEVKIFATAVTLEQITASYGQEVALTMRDGVSHETVDFTGFMQLVTDASMAEELIAASRRNSMAFGTGGSQLAHDFDKKFTPSPLRPLRGPVDFLHAVGLHAVSNDQQGTIKKTPGEGLGSNILGSFLSSPLLKLAGCILLLNLLKD